MQINYMNYYMNYTNFINYISSTFLKFAVNSYTDSNIFQLTLNKAWYINFPSRQKLYLIIMKTLKCSFSYNKIMWHGSRICLRKPATSSTFVGRKY